MDTVYNAEAIADYFILLGIKDGIAITPMKVQKLVYFAHGIFLAQFGKPLINEEIQAWRYGPVIEKLYHKYKVFGNNPIPYYDGSVKNLDDSIKKFLDQVWDLLKKYDAIQLSNLTHVHKSPWDEVIEKHGPIFDKSKPIPNKLIENYFRREYMDRV